MSQSSEKKSSTQGNPDAQKPTRSPGPSSVTPEQKIDREYIEGESATDIDHESRGERGSDRTPSPDVGKERKAS